MTNEELTKLFYKYNIVELSLLSIILSYIKSYEIKDIELSLQEVFNKKLIMGDCYLERQENLFYNVEISDLKNKNNLLSIKELIFLGQITEDASMYLDSIYHIDVEYEKLQVYDFYESINKEICTRKSNKVLSKVKI
ncbi:MAG: hypothetical protein Q4E39_00260 [bacterium]|nr:hypothetical protein [bacterium]